MNPTGIKWERVELPNVARARNGGVLKNTIRLTKPTADRRYNKLYISVNLCEAIGLKEQDSIWLYKYGNLFMIKKESSDYKLRKANPKAARSGLSLTNRDFCDTLLPNINGNIFEAWVEGDGIVFRSKKENEVA